MRPTRSTGKRRHALIAGLSFGAAAVLGTTLLLAFLPRGGPRPAPRPPSEAADEWERGLRASVAASPGDPGPRIELARRLLSARRSHEAAEVAREAAARFPDSAA